MSLTRPFSTLRALFDTATRRARPARLTGGVIVLATLAVGGCAPQPQQFATAGHHGKEYFPSSVYGAASRRVIADGQPIPHGGGQYLVGKPYTVAGQTYVPSERRIVQVGNASWYGDAFHGRLTANGEIYDRDGFTAAHPTMPLPSYARVTNLRNNYSMIVRVNDRGPYASNRIMDVSRRVAEALDYKRYGTTRLKVEYMGRASLAGSDDAKLYATLRAGAPAVWQPEPTMVAAAEPPPARVASLAPYAPPPPRRAWREAAEPPARDIRAEGPRGEDPRGVEGRGEQRRLEARGIEQRRLEGQRLEARRQDENRPRAFAAGSARQRTGAARTQVALVEPPRREGGRLASPRDDGRGTRGQPPHPGSEHTARKPTTREPSGGAETARQFAMLEMGRPPRGAKPPEDTTGSLARSRRLSPVRSSEARSSQARSSQARSSQARSSDARSVTTLPPARPTSNAAPSRAGTHRSGLVRTARARDD